MTEHQFSRSWPRWAGSLQDVLAVADVALREVAKLSGRPPTMRIEVTRRGRGTSVYESLPEFSPRPGRDWSRLRTVTIRMGDGFWFTTPRAALSFGKSIPGLSVEVVGDNEDHVEAALAIIGKQAADHAQFPPSYAVVWIVLGLFLFASALVAAIERVDPSGTHGSVDLAVIAPFVVLLAAAIWLLTPLEVLQPEQRPRLQRFYWIVLLSILLGVVAIEIAKIPGLG